MWGQKKTHELASAHPTQLGASKSLGGSDRREIEKDRKISRARLSSQTPPPSLLAAVLILVVRFEDFFFIAEKAFL